MLGIKSQDIWVSACLKFTFISQELYYFMEAFGSGWILKETESTKCRPQKVALYHI